MKGSIKQDGASFAAASPPNERAPGAWQFLDPRMENVMTQRTEGTVSFEDSRSESQRFVKGFHGVRYQVRDVPRSIAFYTEQLGFKLEHQQPPAFASVSLSGVDILLSGPGASGSRPMPDGQQQEPGGWNRVVLRVAGL